MVGTSMMMASFGFMIYAVSPAYSNSENNNSTIPNSTQGTNGVIVGEYAYFVEGGYLYRIDKDDLQHFMSNSASSYWKKVKLP